jgi:hypothetical protein
MSSGLFCVTEPFIIDFVHNPVPEYILERFIEQLEDLFVLYDRFVSFERSTINLAFTNINNFSSEELRNLHLSIRQLIITRESISTMLHYFLRVSRRHLINPYSVRRVRNIIDEIRSGNSDITDLLIAIEDRLGIPESERRPYLWHALTDL